MKEIKILVLLFLTCIGLTYAQDRSKVLKVESPFRLLQGVTIKSDLRIMASIPIKVEYIQNEWNNSTHHGNQNLSTNIDTNEASQLWLHFSVLNQDNIAQPAIVIDDVLLNENSQRLNPVQFPISSLPGSSRF